MKRFPILVLVGATLCAGACVYGFINVEDYEGSDAFVPKDARALDDLDTIEDTFNGLTRQNMFYVVSTDEGDNIITLNAFQELIEFDKGMKAVRHNWSGKYKNFYDYCYRIDDNSECDRVDHPLDFVEIEPNVYSLSGLKTDADLVKRIQTGKGPQYAENSRNYINVASGMFGDTDPKTVTQPATGVNDLKEAAAMQLRYQIKGDLDIFDKLEDYEIWQF